MERRGKGCTGEVRSGKERKGLDTGGKGWNGLERTGTEKN